MAYLTFEQVTKTFPGVKALSNLSFQADAGEVHALMGENGAGKSTLLKILGGFYQPDQGAVVVQGKKVQLTSPAHAFAAGIAIIHQELQLLGELTIAENMFLGHLPASFGLIKRRELREKAQFFLRRVGMDLNPDTKVKELPIGARQMVEIAKALSRDAKIIAFDEPTSSLSDREANELFRVIAELKAEGKVILYVSHRMAEVFALADRLTVLRDGTHIETYANTKDLTHDRVVRAMVGRDITDVYGYSARKLGSPVLSVRHLTSDTVRKPLSLCLARQEILGVFGLVGAGRSDVLRSLFGLDGKLRGLVEVNGKSVAIKNPRMAIDLGITFCPEDRKRDGIVGCLSVQDNLNLAARRLYLRVAGFINQAWETSHAQKGIDLFRVKASSPEQKINTLSGGNQQKVILARWMSENINVMLLDEPTRGIDVGAKHDIYRLIYDTASKGAGVMMVSSDLSEVMGVSDRIIVMRDGAITGEFLRNDFDSNKILQLALPEQ